MEGQAYLHRRLTGAIVEAAVEVHRALGAGLLESAYAAFLQHEFELRHIGYERELALTLRYKQLEVPFAFRVDFLVEGKVVVEVKSVEALEPIHTAQVLTYLRLTGVRLGLLINFNAYALRHGVKRLIR